MNWNTKKLIAILCAMLIGLCLTACGTSQDASDAGSGGSVNSDINRSARVAKIGNKVITRGDLESFAALNFYTMGYDQYLDSFPEEQILSFKQSILESMANTEAISQYYEKKADADVYGEEYETSLKDFLTQAKESLGDYTKEKNISDEDLTSYYRLLTASQKLYEDVQAENPEESLEEKAQAYYEEHKEDYVNTDTSTSTEETAYRSYEDVKSDILQSLYADLYQEKQDEIAGNAKISVETLK